MTTPLQRACRLLAVLLCALLPSLPAAAQQEGAEHMLAAEPLKPAPGEAVADEEDRPGEIQEQKGGYLGYSLLRSDGYGGRALDYGLLRSNKTAGIYFRHLEKERTFELEGDYLNEKEYRGDLLFDYRGDYRLHLRTESLFHNLDRQPLFSPDFTAPVPGAPLAFHAVPDPPVQYGVAVSQDLAAFRYRLHNYPLHLNLGYWRLVREGLIQQRFADVTFENPNNSVFAVPRHVDRVTQEGSVGFDAHIGLLDFVYLFQVRSFEDRAPIPTQLYNAQGAPDPRAGGVMQHNEDPQSRFVSHTVKLHSTLSDGIVGSASYSIATSENLSKLADTVGASHGKSTVQNAAGDFTYTPCKEFTGALKYRRQEIDRDGFGSLQNAFFGAPVAVRPGVESTKDLFVGTFSFRPALHLSLTAEYRGELLSRRNVSTLPPVITPTTPTPWALPEDSATQTGSLAVFYRPIKGSRLTLKYTYQTTDHPSYGSSFQQKHQGEALGTYTGKRWGVSANVIVKREWNDASDRIAFSSATLTSLTPFQAVSSRERTSQNSNLSLWFTPVERLSLNANYAFVRTAVDQGVLFTSFNPPETPSTFKSRARVFGVGALLAATEKLDLGTNLQVIRSSSSFNPDLVTGQPDTLQLDTSGIVSITQQNTTITNFSVRGGYRFTKEVAATLEYTLRDYDEKNPVLNGYNGTVHAVVAYLMTKW